MRSVLLIFIDGFGLGENDPAVNPLVRFDPGFFRRLFGRALTVELGWVARPDAVLVPTDATLGVPGLPQSATGQTALFTGVNAPQMLGSHIVGFPGPRLAAIIAEHGIMGRLNADGFSVTSANAYTPNYLDLVRQRKRRHSASTLTILGARQPLRSLVELTAGTAVFQDITNEMLPDLGWAVEPVSPAVAGGRLAKLAAGHHFTMFEYFQTDRIGHSRDWQKAAMIVEDLDGFLSGLLTWQQANKAKTLTIITSDHGNFEDFSRKSHTLNLVPTIILGAGGKEIGSRLRDLTDICPAIIDYIKGDGPR